MPQPTVDEILIECSLHVGIGIPKGKHLTKKAIAHLEAEFRPRLQRGIDQGVDWAANRATVLSVCELLGRRAASRADNKGQIHVPAVRQAVVEIDKKCEVTPKEAKTMGRTCPK